MGAFEGSLSFKTFFVEGEPPSDFHDDYLARIKKYGFVELTPEDEDDRRMGWVSVEQPLDTEFTRNKVFFNTYIALSLRIDKWAIPSSLLKAHTKEATLEYLSTHDIPRLGRREKEELKEMVEARLKRRLVPAMKVIDMAWNIHSGVLRFWTHSATTCEEFQELFEETFDLHIVPDSPYTSAKDLGLGEDELERLANLDPEWFILPEV